MVIGLDNLATLLLGAAFHRQQQQQQQHHATLSLPSSHDAEPEPLGHAVRLLGQVRAVAAAGAPEVVEDAAGVGGVGGGLRRCCKAT
jgi:hypothetical protein